MYKIPIIFTLILWAKNKSVNRRDNQNSQTHAQSAPQSLRKS